MQTIARLISINHGRPAALALCAGVLCVSSLIAGSPTPVTATPAEDTSYNNWLNTTVGGLIIDGNKAQFQQQNPTLGPVYGGVSDAHYEQALTNKTTFTIDGHALFDNNDYKLILALSQADVGYIKVGYTGYSTYYNGNGGYIPPTPGMHTTQSDGLLFAGPEHSLYRGSLWAELGLRMPTLPELTLRYEHDIRNGQEDSTSWGGYNTQQSPVPLNYNSSRKILPSFWGINETRDIFNFTGKQGLGKPDSFGNTDLNLGLHYEFDNTQDSLNYQNLTGTNLPSSKLPPTAANYYMTQANQEKLNNYSGNLSSVTRFGDKLWLTMGYAYSDVASTLGGNGIAGPSYGFGYQPTYNGLTYANVSHTYQDVSGGSDVGQNVASINLMWMPLDGLTIAPSGRFQFTDTTSQSAFFTEVSAVTANTITTNTVTKVKTTNTVIVTPAGIASSQTLYNSSVFLGDYTGSLQIRYTKIRDWVFYAQGDMDQQYEQRNDGTLPGSYGAKSASNTLTSSYLKLRANNSWLNQKYQLGANWYPLPNLNASVQYYWQTQNDSQYIPVSDPTKANQRLMNQYWNTQDGNARLTWTPFSTLSLVSRYDVQRCTIDSQWANDYNGAGQPFTWVAPYGQSSVMNNQMFTENATWSPVDRLYLQGGLSYVLNETTSGAASMNNAILPSKNNYWTANAGIGYQIDPKTEIRGDFTYYSANDYVNNAQYGTPYGAGASEYTFSASIKRQITKNINLSLKYYFDTYIDQLSGGNNSYTAQMIATSLQMRF